MPTIHYNSPAEFVLSAVVGGLGFVFICYMPVTVFGVFRAYYLAGMKGSKNVV